jgi:DNA-binding GntR family transcriptional regulator
VIEAVLADAPVAEQLHVSEGAALLRFERRMVLDDRRTIELGFVRCRGDRLALASSLVRAQPHERTDAR